MSDILFFARTAVLTIAVVMVMQIEVGQRTIESHALSWIHASPVVAPLNAAAKGATRLIRESSESLRKNFKNPFR